MNYEKLLDGMKRFGSNETDVCLHGLGLLPEHVHENVIIAPWWDPSLFPALGKASPVCDVGFTTIQCWDIETDKDPITFIRTGIGAPVLVDALLALGVTRCRKIIFIGAIGALSPDMGIGDIIIPEYSICGDGVSRYIAYDSLSGNDCFGKKAYPDAELTAALKNCTKEACSLHNVTWHTGRIFSIDTIFAQFAHIDEILSLGVNAIEMETAAAFLAGEVAGLKVTALFNVSDNTVANKSLVSGRSKEELDYRAFVRKELFPKIMLSAFSTELPSV